MNSVVQYAQDVIDMSRRNHYVDADCAILGWCMAGSDGVVGALFIPTTVWPEC